jgi:hypothetical protein
MVRRRIFLGWAFLAVVALPACGTPPDKEIQQARGAIDAARAVGADQYAAEEFTAAENALKSADTAVDQRDYRMALNYALDARDPAQTAAKQAADRKAEARVDADRAVTEAAAALAAARDQLKAVEAARVPARTIAAQKRAVAAGDKAVQEARADLEKGSYLAAAEAARRAASQLQAVAKELETKTTGGPRRRR